MDDLVEIKRFTPCHNWSGGGRRQGVLMDVDTASPKISTIARSLRHRIRASFEAEAKVLMEAIIERLLGHLPVP